MNRTLSSTAGALGRALLFSVGQIAATVVFAALSILSFPLPYPQRYRFITNWTRFNLWWLEKTCRLGYRVVGRENIPPHPVIVFSKHESAWETFSLQLLFVPQVWVLKRELLWIPFFGWALSMLKPIAIDRSAGRQAMSQVIEQGTARLHEGASVVVFPEGTRVAPGTKHRYLMGGAMLAKKSGFPVVPVAHNAGDFWPRNSFTKQRGEITLIIGEPIITKNKSAADINRIAQEFIETSVARIRAARAPRVEIPAADGERDCAQRAPLEAARKK